jgi:hypothetical protein
MKSAPKAGVAEAELAGTFEFSSEAGRLSKRSIAGCEWRPKSDDLSYRSLAGCGQLGRQGCDGMLFAFFESA